jgi:ribosomal protein S18 acetylase RimI-like enzyme
MAFNIRRLNSNDTKTLSLLAREDADFDVQNRGKGLDPLDEEAARGYLANPSLLHWVVEDEGAVIGYLCGYVLPLRAGGVVEFLLYEIGVRSAYRSRGVGKSLMKTMFDWMRANGATVAWVIADNPGAVEFYQKCGFEKTEGTLTQMEARII